MLYFLPTRSSFYCDVHIPSGLPDIMLMEINYGGDTRAYEHARPPMDITLLMRVLVCVCVCVCVCGALDMDTARYDLLVTANKDGRKTALVL